MPKPSIWLKLYFFLLIHFLLRVSGPRKVKITNKTAKNKGFNQFIKMNFQKAAPNEDEGEEQKAAPKDEDEEGEEQKAAPNEEDNKKGKKET